jgi:hypothetical protein
MGSGPAQRPRQLLRAKCCRDWKETRRETEALLRFGGREPVREANYERSAEGESSRIKELERTM